MLDVGTAGHSPCGSAPCFTHLGVCKFCAPAPASGSRLAPESRGSRASTCLLTVGACPGTAESQGCRGAGSLFLFSRPPRACALPQPQGPPHQAEQMAVVRAGALCKAWELEGRLRSDGLFSQGRDVRGVSHDCCPKGGLQWGTRCQHGAPLSSVFLLGLSW